METRIPGRDGTTTIHSDSYGFGSINVGPSIPPENPDRWTPRQLLRYADILKRYGWTDDEYTHARGSLGFPESLNGSTYHKPSLRWYEEKIREWEDGIRKMAARLPKR